MSSLSRILFIELLGGLGDVLIALPAMQAIAQSHPQASLTVLTFAPGGDLLHHHPQIDRVIQIPAGNARAGVEQILSLSADAPYDLIITDTTYDGIADLVEQSAAAHPVTNLWRNPPNDQRVGDRFLQLLHEDGWITEEALHANLHPRIYLTEAERVTAQARLSYLPHPRIGLYPDAGMAIKRWSMEHFITLGQALYQQYQVSVIIPEGVDPTVVQAITAQIPTSQPWPRGTLRELAALFAQLDAIVAADTGPARIAAALGVPTITLFGPSWGNRYGQPPPHVNLQGEPDCPERHISNFTTQICWYSGQCPYPWPTCVDRISPESVLDRLMPILQKTKEQEARTAARAIRPVTVSSSTFLHLHAPSPSHILAIRLDNIGDVIMTSPALKALKEREPGTRLTLLASSAGSLAAPVLPWVDDVITWRSLWQDLGRLSFDPEREWELVDLLKSQQFDAAVIFTSFKQSPYPPAFICQLAGIPVRIAAFKERDIALTHPIPSPPDDEHQVERNLQLVEAAGYPVGDRALQIHVPSSTLIPDRPYVLLNPWTSCPSRTYDLERFGSAAERLSEETGYQVVITGVDKDRDRAHSLLKILGDRAINVMGKTTFGDLVALVAHAQLLLSNNTSTMHIADATRTPSVILFAGTELERQWRPRSTRAILLRRPTPCSPCYQFDCPYNLECLDIAPDEIVAAGLSLLREESLCR